MSESGKFLLVESGIQLKESGIPLSIKIQNPLSTKKSGIQFQLNPESKTVLNSLWWDDGVITFKSLQNRKLKRVGLGKMDCV